MNFYLGNSIKEVDVKGKNIEFSDELIDYIYRLRNNVSLDMSTLYNIDPYSDVKIPKTKVKEIVEICKYLLKEDLIDEDECEDGINTLEELIEMGEKAEKNGMGLVSIGD